MIYKSFVKYWILFDDFAFRINQNVAFRAFSIDFLERLLAHAIALEFEVIFHFPW